MRVSKKHDVRMNEILDAAELLFVQKGYEKATINDILEKVEIGKGTFYHYFKSKEEVMNAVIGRMVDMILNHITLISNTPGLNAQEKMRRIIQSLRISDGDSGGMIEELHRPSNAMMHQKSMIDTIQAVAPVLAAVVEQGVREGIYHTQYPLETIEFLLTANQLIFDEGIFQWKRQERAARAVAYVRNMELLLGAAANSFDFVLHALLPETEGSGKDEAEHFGIKFGAGHRYIRQ